MLHGRLLNYLDEVARSGSIRKAAERMNVAPSAISRQILTFEEELGTPVFQRRPKKLVLTAAGEVLIRHIRGTLKDLDRVQTQIEELKGLRRGEITVAVMSGLAANLVPRCVVEFQKSNPRVKLTFSCSPQATRSSARSKPAKPISAWALIFRHAQKSAFWKQPSAALAR
jgi:DNA-binding transcriptional LysR family regulator